MAFSDAERSLRTHGKELVTQLPEETTQLLLLLCTGYRAVGAAADGLGGVCVCVFVFVVVVGMIVVARRAR